MSEMAEATATPERNVAEWAAYQHFQDIYEAFKNLTPLGWAMHPEPDGGGRFYIGGPPDTEVIAEGLTQENAEAIVNVVNNLPEALEYFEDLAKMWDLAMDLNDDGEEKDKDEFFHTITDVVNRYQIRIAQAEANPAPVPAVATAEDLSYMHVGHLLTVEGVVSAAPIVGVQAAGDTLVRVTLAQGYRETTLIIPKTIPASVSLLGKIAEIAPQSENPDITSPLQVDSP